MSLLKSAIIATPKSTWVAFDGEISFELKYVSRPILKALTDRCSVVKYDPKSKTHKPTVDGESLTKEFLAAGVVGWNGVTYRTLANYVPLDVASIDAARVDEAIPFSQDELFELIQNSKELDAWIYETAMDAKFFNTSVMAIKKEDAAKN